MHKLPRDPLPRDRRQAAELGCSSVEPLLEACLDDQLSGSEQSALKDHLARCESCTEELDLARRIQTELHALPPRSCPPVVTRAVLDHAESHPPLAVRLRRFRSARQVWQPAFALLVVAALGLGYVGLGYWRPDGPAPPVGPAQKTYTEAEIARAEAEIKLALAYLGDIGQRTREQLGAEMGERILEPFSRSIAGALLPFPRVRRPRSKPDADGKTSDVS